jgi:hypothetical protein
VIAGEYFDYADALEKEQGVSGCPMECAKASKRYDPNRTELCKKCPRAKQMKIFKDETLERWKKWFGKDARKFNFEAMLRTFYSVKSFEGMSDELMSVKTSSLVTIMLTEKAKAQIRNMPTVAAG